MTPEKLIVAMEDAWINHLHACGRCRRARGTLQPCDKGAKLFRRLQSENRKVRHD